MDKITAQEVYAVTQQHIRTAMAAHCARYPRLEDRDLLKLIHHSAFGCGHLISDVPSAEEWLRREMDGCGEGGSIEYLPGGFCRVPLGHLKALGVSPCSFARLFALSAQKEVPGTALAEELLSASLDMAREGLLPFSYDDFSREAQAWRQAGYPALHHSDTFRDIYRPAYRVLHTSHAALLPLLAAIERKLAVQERITVVIEGGAGSGKSTLAAFLHTVYGCTVLHMDDFFLRREQRTPQRYATPGGNIDHERFLAEVVTPLTEGRTFRYRPFDCATFTVAEGYDITPGALTVVEGSYSMHPALGAYYDLAVWVDIDENAQRARIEARNSPAFAQRFFDEWIPLEQAYFTAFDTAARCDLRVEVQL